MTRVDVADCVAWAEAYDGPPFHALLCDPPYELGFMGRAWDRSGVAFNPDTWRALARVLHPGGFGMAFASSRGWHRLAVAIEDAGLTIHPSIFGWAFGNGFPKATRIVAAPDFTGHRYGLQALKPALEPIIVFQKPYAGRPVDSITATGAGALNVDGGRVPTGGDMLQGQRPNAIIGPEVTSWENDHNRLYSGVDLAGKSPKQVTPATGAYTAPSPAVPTSSARASIARDDIDRATIGCSTGPCQAGQSIGQCDGNNSSIDTSGSSTTAPCQTATKSTIVTVTDSTIESTTSNSSPEPSTPQSTSPSGRWPANLVVCHTPDCERVGERRVRGTTAVRHVSGGNTFGGDSPKPAMADATYADADGLETVAAYACAPGCPVAALGAQSGELRTNPGTIRTPNDRGMFSPAYVGHVVSTGDTGTAARFYHNPDFALDIAERLAAAEPVRYVAKASRRERNAGCEGLALMRAGNFDDDGHRRPGERRNDHTAPHPRANGHPTVKPLTLARHLATLLLPPDAYAPRRLFVPFAGSGSECIGGMLAGWDEVVGVELSDEYAEIARARLAWWEANRPADAPTQLPLAVNE